MRGRITPQIIAVAKNLLGIENISTDELRMMPYIQYQVMNEKTLDPLKMNQSDRKILRRWKDKGWVDGGASAESLSVSKEFWDAMNEILWISYVDI